MDNKTKTDQNKGYLMIVAAGSLWGTIGIFSTTLANMGLNSAYFSFFRMLSSSVMLALILLIKGRGVSLFRISKKGLLSCVLVGVIAQALFNICYMSTIEHSGMATGAVFLYTSPVFVAIMSRLFFSEPLTGNKIIAIIINIIGCTLAVTGGNFSDLNISGKVIVVGVLAGFTYALFPVLSRTGADKEDPFTAAFYGQLFGMIFLFFVMRPYNGVGTEFNWKMVIILILVGIIPSAMANSAFYSGLSRMTETSKVPVFASVETIVAALLGFIVFGQSLGIAKIAGIALVICSIAVMNINKTN